MLVAIKQLGHKALTITNVPGSTLSREADLHYFTCGSGNCSCFNKGVYCSSSCISYLGQVVAHFRKQVSLDLVKELGIVATVMEALCDSKEAMESIAREFLSVTRNCFFIGRSRDYYVGLKVL